MYVHELTDWPRFRWDVAKIAESLASVRHRQGRLIGRMEGLGFNLRQEAVLNTLTEDVLKSSDIEGEKLDAEQVRSSIRAASRHGHRRAETDRPQYADIHEVVNYRKALVMASEVVRDRPLTLALIRQMHKVLMNSVRGENKSPGEFRRDQNWIGPPGCSLEDATFVPPAPLQLLDYLQTWEVYFTSANFWNLAATNTMPDCRTSAAVETGRVGSNFSWKPSRSRR